MAHSVGADSLIDFSLLSAVQQISAVVLIVGVLMFSAGVILMLRHLKHWQNVQATEKDLRLQKFEFRKFRRRGIAACLLSISGSTMAALYWAEDARVFAILTTILMAAIIGILGLAVFDLIGVSLNLAEPNDEAQKRMMEEVRKLKEKQQQEELQKTMAEELAGEATDEANMPGDSNDSDTGKP